MPQRHPISTWCVRFSLLILYFATTSCLKNNDKTSAGPKSQIRVTNYVANTASFDIAINGMTIGSVPLSYGNSVAMAGSLYMPAASGFQHIQLTTTSGSVINRTLNLEREKNFSLFIFDTVRSDSVKMVLFTDDIVPVDTMGRIRFLQFIPASDSLSMILVKNNDAFAIRDNYIGNKRTPTEAGTFNYLVEPDTYQLRLMNGNNVLFEQASLVIQPGKVYSFIAKGITGGTGIYKESLEVITHN